MADTSADNTEDAEKKRKITLEEKSKEDLIKLVRKYLNLLQKAKNKSDELNEKCSVFEKEKNAAIQDHQSTEKELLGEIAALRKNVTELTTEKVVNSIEKDQEISELKKKLKESNSVKTPSLREHEDDLQCLNLQLQSLKASCQCIQEENVKLQRENKELSEKILKLEHHKILNDNHKEEISVLSKQIEDLRKENENYKTENDSANKTDISIFFRDNQNLNKENKELKLQIETLKDNNQKLADINSKNILHIKEQKEFQSEISLHNENTFDQAEILKLRKCKATLETKMQELQSELVKCHLEKDQLRQEVEKLSSLAQNYKTDFKTGIELALLQGVSTETLMHSCDQYRAISETAQANKINIKNQETVINPDTNMFSLQDTTGLEQALLHGGDMSYFMETNIASHEIVCSNEPIYDNKDTIKNYEIESMHQKLIEYSDLCRDTLEENKNLQEELEALKKSKVLVHQEVNTDFDYLKNIENVTSEVSTLNENEGNLSFEQNYTDLSTEIYNLYKKICSLWKDKTDLELPSDDPLVVLKNIEKLYSELECNFENNCSKLNDFNMQLELLVIGIKQGVRQKNTSSYQTENNLEENLSLLKVLLDDLVMRSNNYACKIRNFESNMIAEKKNIEDELIQIKELNQFLEDENRELNVEVKKLKCILNNSHKNCCNGDYYRENYQMNPELYSIDESNELDEKTDANANVATFDNIFKKSADTCDVAIQTLHIVQNCAVQVEPDLLHKSIGTSDLIVKTFNNFSTQVETDLLHKNIDISDLTVKNNCAVQVETKFLECVTKDCAIQAVHPVYNNAVQVQLDLQSNIEEKSLKNEDSALIINNLTKENKVLKEKIQEKSTLVENIHCEMDSLLSKIEELNDELHEKEDDLKHSKHLNADLKKLLIEVENTKKQQNVALKFVQDSVLELKIKNNNLNDDIKSYGLTFKEFILHVNDNIMNIMKQSCISVDDYVKKCNHQEQIFNLMKEWMKYLAKDFNTYLNFFNQITNDEIKTLEQKTSALIPQEFISHFKASDQDICCSVSEDIEQLNSIRLNFFSKFSSYFNNNFISLIKNLDYFKLDVIPKMEKDIFDLENKLAKCICHKDSVEKVVQKEHEEVLKNQLADVETKMTKLKKLAINLKKELAQTKEQYSEISSEKEHLQKQNTKLLEELSKISDDQCKYVQNFQSLQNEFDKLQDECEMYKINIKKQEEDSSTKLLEFDATKKLVMDLEAELDMTKHSLETYLTIKNELEVKCVDLESKVIVLESKINEKVQKINSLDLEISKHLKDFNAVWDENKNLKNQLELAQKEENKKSLLHLEMADYERSISELNNQIFKKEEEIKELQSELDCMKEKYDCLQEEMRSTETLKETEAKRAENLRQILEKAKLDLTEVKEHEIELLSKNASLEIQLETLIQQDEQTKLHLSEASVQVQHLQDVIKTSSDNHQRIVRSFEQKISNQKEEIVAAHKEVESVKQEFENYKIRVHSVLKQQKSSTPVTTLDADLREKLENMNDKLKMQIKDLSEKLTALSLEYETLQEEHEGLLQKYNKAIDDRETKDKEWHQRLEQVNSEKIRLRAAQEEISSQHLLQNEMLVATYKKQIKIMSDEHKRIVSDLQKQLDNADVEIARLQRDQQKQQGLPLTPLPQDNHPFDIMTQERQEGEGSENTDETTTPIKHLSLATIPTPGFLPFEKLIQSPIEPGTPASYISSHDSEKLSYDLNTANKKIDHLNELLNDSESTNMRLSEQVRVLKEEVRRLENNKEREQHAENLEYLKNVFIKFASLQPGSEKAMLIPVLTTMLKLSFSEQQQLKSVSGDFGTDDYSNSGWSSYLHRWSGLS